MSKSNARRIGVLSLLTAPLALARRASLLLAVLWLASPELLMAQNQAVAFNYHLNYAHNQHLERRSRSVDVTRG
jgi:hypothetical protein